MDRALEPAGVTSSQFTVMALVHTHPDSSSADVARRVGVTAQTMKDLVANLEAASLVRRDRHPEHGRILTLHLTDRGEAALERCWRLARQVERRMLLSFTSEERRVFVDHLRRAGDALLHDEGSRPRA